MIRAGFLDEAIRDELTALMRDGKEEMRVARRANALLLLDDGWSCQEVAEALYMDDDTIRYWHELYQEKGLKWLAEFGYKGRACEMTAEQQAALTKWVTETLPRTTSVVGRMDREDLWHQLHTLGPDQTVGATGHGISQAQSDTEEA